MVSKGKKISSSIIKCPDGSELAVTISEGRAQLTDQSVVVIEFLEGEAEHQTWFAHDPEMPPSRLDLTIGKILGAAKHSQEFRQKLRLKHIDYPQDECLSTLLDQFEKPGFIEQCGNLQETDVHAEVGTVINFPDGMPALLEKEARKARWLSIRKGDSQIRLRVYGAYGHAHIYNSRLRDFLQGVLSGALERKDYQYLDLPSNSTIISTAGSKRPKIVVAPDDLAAEIETLKSHPASDSRDLLLKLKVGRDTWSSIRLPELESRITNQNDLDRIRAAFRKPVHQATASRWYLRGLPAPHAILKTKLDIERGMEHSLSR